MKAIKFEESEYYSIKLPRGTYLVDNKVVEVEGYGNADVQVLDIENVCPISRTSIITKYVSQDEIEISASVYNKAKDELLLYSTKTDEEYDGQIKWNSLDDEFAYRKFLQKWTPVYKNIEVVGDKYSFDIQHTKINTGCKYINSTYINGGDDPMLFEYNRPKAFLDIVNYKFADLGMAYTDSVSYQQTDRKKIWGNSTHSCIRYVVAFGTYVFNDAFDVKYSPKGKLEDLLKMYNDDKQRIESQIQTKYNIHFGKVDQDLFDFDGLLKFTNIAIKSANNVEYKQKSYSEYNSLCRNLSKIKSMIEESYKVKDNEANKEE